jgi:hypothetical protein
MWWTNAEQAAVWKKLDDGTYVYENCIADLDLLLGGEE